MVTCEQGRATDANHFLFISNTCFCCPYAIPPRLFDFLLLIYFLFLVFTISNFVFFFSFSRKHCDCLVFSPFQYLKALLDKEYCNSLFQTKKFNIHIRTKMEMYVHYFCECQSFPCFCGRKCFSFLFINQNNNSLQKEVKFNPSPKNLAK